MALLQIIQIVAAVTRYSCKVCPNANVHWGADTINIVIMAVIYYSIEFQMKNQAQN